MKNSGGIQIATRYVNALFDVAQSASAVAAIEKELSSLSATTAQDAIWTAFLHSPLLSSKQQADTIATLADRFSLHALTKAFLVTLAKAKRLDLLEEIATQFAKKAEEARGELTAELVTAHVAQAAEIATVAERLGNIYRKKITLATKQDPSLLGGALIKIGSLQLDSSLAGKLQRIEHRLKAA